MVYVGSVYVFGFWFLMSIPHIEQSSCPMCATHDSSPFFGFWFLLGLSLVGLSLQVVIWGSVCPPPLVFCCAGVDRLCWNWFFRVYKVLRLFSCSCSVVCSHYLVVSPDRSWVVLVWLPLPPSPSSVLSCWCFLCWWFSSFQRYPGVHSFYLLFFVIGVGGRQNGLRLQECILWYLKYQPLV